jgi:hypothetical protein
MQLYVSFMLIIDSFRRRSAPATPSIFLSIIADMQTKTDLLHFPVYAYWASRFPNFSKLSPLMQRHDVNQVVRVLFGLVTAPWAIGVAWNVLTDEAGKKSSLTLSLLASSHVGGDLYELTQRRKFDLQAVLHHGVQAAILCLVCVLQRHVFCCCCCTYVVQRHVTRLFRVVPERVHKSYIVSFATQCTTAVKSQIRVIWSSVLFSSSSSAPSAGAVSDCFHSCTSQHRQ